MTPLYVGIDVSSSSNVIYFMKPDGTKHSCFPVANSLKDKCQAPKLSSYLLASAKQELKF